MTRLSSTCKPIDWRRNPARLPRGTPHSREASREALPFEQIHSRTPHPPVVAGARARGQRSLSGTAATHDCRPSPSGFRAAGHLATRERCTGRAKRSGAVFNGALALACAVTLQAGIGIVTLLHQAPLPLALLHQIMGIVVLTIAVLHAEQLAPRYNAVVTGAPLSVSIPRGTT